MNNILLSKAKSISSLFDVLYKVDAVTMTSFHKFFNMEGYEYCKIAKLLDEDKIKTFSVIYGEVPSPDIIFTVYIYRNTFSIFGVRLWSYNMSYKIVISKSNMAEKENRIYETIEHSGVNGTKEMERFFDDMLTLSQETATEIDLTSEDVVKFFEKKGA